MSNRQKMTTQLKLFVCVTAIGLAIVSEIQAATQTWLGGAQGYPATTGIWATAETDINATNWTGRATWTNNNDALFTSANALVIISNSVTALSISLAGAGGQKTTITNGTLHLGAGGITMGGNQTHTIWSSIVLDTDQTWKIGTPVVINGDISGNAPLIKSGTSTLSLYNSGNTYTGGTMMMGGTLTYAGATSGTPLGPGSLTFNNGPSTNSSWLYLTPGGSGSNIALAGGTNGNNTIAFDGYARILVNTGKQNSVTYTFGNSADTGSVFVRNGRGLLSIMDNASGGMGAAGRFKLANGINNVPIHNGMVDAYLTSAQQNLYFLTYNETTGLINLVPEYSWGTGIQPSVNDNTRIYKTTGNSGKQILTNTCSIYALDHSTAWSCSLLLTNNTVMNLGNGVQPAGLLLGNSSIDRAANSPDSRIDFGASEGIVYNTYNKTANITVPIAGSNGVTFCINPTYGGLTLSATNTYTGATTIYGGMPVTLANGGSLAAGSSVTIYSGGGLLLTNNAIVNGVLTTCGTANINNGGTLASALTVGAGGVMNINNGGLASGETATVMQGVLTVNAGGTVSGNVNAELSANNGTANVINSGTIANTLTIKPPVSGPTYVFGNNAVAGYAKLNAGSVTGPVVANGRLDITGAVTAGTLSGVNTNGLISNSSSVNNTLTFQGGSSFSQFRFETDGSQATLQQTGAGGVHFNFWGYNTSTPKANYTFNGGTWTLGNIGQNNTGAQTTGTNTLTSGATVTVVGSTAYSHGTWNVINGALTFNGGIAENNGNTAYCALVLNVNSSGSGPGVLTAGALTLADGGSQSLTNSLSVDAGGTVNLTGVTLGSTTARTAELDRVNLNGGKLAVNGGITAAAVTTGQTRLFNWTDGQLTALNITPSAGFSTPASGGISATTLIQSGGAFAPGDIGTAGKTTVTGSYSNMPSAVLAMDIGGTSQGSAFTNASGYYDYLLVNNGSTYLSGKLMISLINGYVPASPSTAFTIVNNTGTGAGVSGTFANLTSKTILTTDGYSLFTNITQSATQVILSGYVRNEYVGGNWDSTATWSQNFIPANQDYAAYFGTLASSFSPNVGTRTLKGLVFANATGFTLSGNLLTLQGDTSIKVTAGSHTISVPVALASATEIAVAGSSVLTLSGSLTGAQNVTKTGTGTLALGGVNTLGLLTVNAGTVKQAGGTTTLSALALSTGSTYDLWSGTLRIAEGTAGGAIDTVAEVEAAITAGTIQGRGKTLPTSEFKISVADGTVSVELKFHGTVITFQ